MASGIDRDFRKGFKPSDHAPLLVRFGDWGSLELMVPTRSELTKPHSENFRTVLGRLPTGVVVVTGGDPEHPSGLVVGSFMSVSLEPPLVAVCPAKTSTSWPAIEAAGTLLRQRARRGPGGSSHASFAASGGDKFAGVDWAPAPATGAPLLDGVAAWIDCRIYERYEAGDHWLVLGEVLELSVPARRRRARVPRRQRSGRWPDRCTHSLRSASSETFTRAADDLSSMAHILVVDDEPAVRRALERALRLDNYEVELADRRRGGA